MIIVYENNYPLVIFKIDKFDVMEYRTLKKEINYFNKKAISEDVLIYLNIDLYDLGTYSNYYITEILKYVNSSNFTGYAGVKFYINKKNTGYIMKAGFYIMNYKSTIPVDLIELDAPRKWK